MAQVVVKEVEVEVEVESQQMAGQRQALENYSRAVEEQRNRLGQVMDGDCSCAQVVTCISASTQTTAPET